METQELVYYTDIKVRHRFIINENSKENFTSFLQLTDEQRQEFVSFAARSFIATMLIDANENGSFAFLELAGSNE